MAKLYFSLAMLLLFSCNTTEQLSTENTDTNAKKRLVVHRNLVHSFKTDTSSLEIRYDYYPTTTKAYEDSVNRLICEFIRNRSSYSANNYPCVLNERNVYACLDTFASFYYEDEYEESILWEFDSNIEIKDAFTDFVELHLSEWQFTGGAHGNGTYTILKLDKIDGSALGLSEFFTDSEELNRIAETYFRELMELGKNDDLTEAGFWFQDGKFSVNDNFFFASNQVTFFYNAYEIAPYAGGSTELKIPLDKIAHLLKRKVD